MDINLKNKIQQALNSDFIGLIKFDDDEIVEMCNDCKNIFLKMEEDGGKSPDNFNNKESIYMQKGEFLVCFIAVTQQITSSPSFDERVFFDIILSKIFDFKIDQSFFYSNFQRIFKEYNKPLFKSEAGRTMYRESLLAQALMPYMSIFDFVRLLYSWYTNKDIYNYKYTHGKLLDEVYTVLNTEFTKNKNDDLRKLYGAVYNIKASIRYIFLQNEKLSKMLLNQILQDIEKYHHGCDITDKNYIQEIICSVIDSPENKVQKGKKGKVIVNGYNNVNPTYKIVNEKFCLCIPQIKPDNELGTKICYKLFNNDKLIKNIDKVVKGKLTIDKRIDEELIEIDIDEINNLNLKFNIYILHDSMYELVYSSKESLYRKYLLFNNNGTEIKNKNILSPTKIYYFITFDSINSSIKNYSFINSSDYVMLLEPAENEFIEFNETKLFFTNSQKFLCELSGANKFNDIQKIEYEYNGNIYTFFRKVNTLKISFNNKLNEKDMKIRIDGNDYAINELKHEIIEKCLIIDFTNFNSNGMHNILIKSSDVFESLYYYINNDFIFDDFERHVFSEKELNFSYEINNKQYIETIMPNQETLEINLQEGKLTLYFYYVKWKFDSEIEYNYTFNKYKLWHEDELLHNNFLIDIQTNINKYISLMIDDIEIEINKNFDNILNEKLLNDNKKAIVFLKFKNNKYPLFKIYFKPKIKNNFNILNDFFDRKKYFIGNNEEIILFIDGKEISIDDDGFLEEHLEDNIYSKIGFYQKNRYTGENIFINEFDNRIIGNINKFRFLEQNIIVSSNLCKKNVSITFNKFIKDIKYCDENVEGNMCTIFYKGICNDEIVYFELTIPIDSPFNYKINELMKITFPNKTVNAFYKKTKLKNEKNIYYYNIIKESKHV